eukprot:5071215-Pleurochrysis_carterae.AAC.1
MSPPIRVEKLRSVCPFAEHAVRPPCASCARASREQIESAMRVFSAPTCLALRVRASVQGAQRAAALGARCAHTSAPAGMGVSASVSAS